MMRRIRPAAQELSALLNAFLSDTAPAG